MTSLRPNATLATFDGGPVVHHDVPTAFAEAVRRFLEKV
jgi:methionine synthase I (cobalamin-dependent)